MKEKNKVKLIKIIVSLVIIILLAFISAKIYPYMVNLGTIDGQNKFKALVANYHILGVIILFLLNLLQMFLMVLPGEPIEILFGLCYGWFGGTILNILSIFVNTTIIVLLVKRYGKKFVCLFFKEQDIDKWERKLLKDPQKLLIVILLIFLMPGTPKDLFVFLIGTLPINGKKFVALTTLARIPSVLSSCLVGANLLKGNFLFIILIYLLSFLLPLISILVVNKKNRNNYFNIIK